MTQFSHALLLSSLAYRYQWYLKSSFLAECQLLRPQDREWKLLVEKSIQKKVSGPKWCRFLQVGCFAHVCAVMRWAHCFPGRNCAWTGKWFGGLVAEIKMWVTTEVVIITSSDLIQDRRKPLILALHNNCNIIRTYYDLVLLEIQVVWTGIHFIYISKWS